MATITFKGDSVITAGHLPPVGDRAPDFKLTGADLSTRSLGDFHGKRKILSIVPSLDAGVCATSARTFNEKVGSVDNAVLLNISADLPFASKRFCESEKLEHIHTLSVFRAPSFGTDYGVTMIDGPLAGLLARAIVVLDEQDQILYTELVPEIVQEPDYDAALSAVK